MNKFPKSEIVAQTWVRLYANPFQGKIFWEIDTRAKIVYNISTTTPLVSAWTRHQPVIFNRLQGNAKYLMYRDHAETEQLSSNEKLEYWDSIE